MLELSKLELVLHFDFLMLGCILSQHIHKPEGVLDGLGPSVVIEVNPNFSAFTVTSLMRGTYESEYRYGWQSLPQSLSENSNATCYESHSRSIYPIICSDWTLWAASDMYQHRKCDIIPVNNILSVIMLSVKFNRKKQVFILVRYYFQYVYCRNNFEILFCMHCYFRYWHGIYYRKRCSSLLQSFGIMSHDI